jgi:hypothetical protein
VWAQQGDNLVGSNAVGAAQQGYSVALSGDGNTAIIGGAWDGGTDEGGAAWAFSRSGGLWTQQGTKLLGSVMASKNQGSSVALSDDGNTAAIGAPGYADPTLSGNVFVFTRSGSTWTQQGPPLVGTPGSGGQEQGYSVALSSNAKTLLSGAPGSNGLGGTWVFVAPDFNAAATHDFNGDGKSDIAWQDTNGNTAIWLMNGATALSSGGIGVVPTTWAIVGQRDFNGDGMADFLWRDAGGDTAIWFMSGTQVASSTAIGNIPTNWTVVGTGDFNGDGFGDILWRDTSGNLAVWLMNGANVISSAGLGDVPLTFALGRIGDFNGDGKADLLWLAPSGMSMWFMNGTQVASSALVSDSLGLATIPQPGEVFSTGDFDGRRQERYLDTFQRKHCGMADERGHDLIIRRCRLDTYELVGRRHR